MPDTKRCPDCGHENPPGSESCAACNFPLSGLPVAPAPVAPSGGESGAGKPDSPVVPRMVRPIRPRRPRPASNQATTLWLTFGSILAVVVLFIGLKANVERASQPVAGSSPEEQKHADELRAALEKDSTNVDARVALADVLYNTANWSEAIVHYRSAVHHDSTRTPAIVDLGVCYYNLGDPEEAERYFLLGLARDPHHPIALFNLGIVSEHRGNLDAALDYFHRALQSAPPGNMSGPITDAMQRVMKQQGKEAPPLPGAR
jgi:cytochrome c-type biogenesis protein CcmH/NrfG